MQRRIDLKRLSRKESPQIGERRIGVGNRPILLALMPAATGDGLDLSHALGGIGKKHYEPSCVTWLDLNWVLRHPSPLLSRSHWKDPSLEALVSLRALSCATPLSPRKASRMPAGRCDPNGRMLLSISRRMEYALDDRRHTRSVPPPDRIRLYQKRCRGVYPNSMVSRNLCGASLAGSPHCRGVQTVCVWSRIKYKKIDARRGGTFPPTLTPSNRYG